MTDNLEYSFQQDTKAKRVNSVQARETGSPQFDMPGGGIGSPLFFAFGQAADEAPPYSVLWPRPRDAYLRTFTRNVAPLAGAVYSLTARMKALDFAITNARPRAKSYSQDVVKGCENGRGIRALIGKLMADILMTDNGGFVELVGTGDPLRPLNGKLVAPYMLHIDSLQCWRTFDPEFPVVYTNPLTGEMRKLHRTRVVSVSSFEAPEELGRGVGFCGVSRVLRYSQYIRDVIQYKYEKTHGSFNRGLIYGNGINGRELTATMYAADNASRDQDFSVYKGIPIITRAGEVPMNLQMLDLAGIGDGFDTKSDMEVYINMLALAFGVDTREFYPATSTGATKADASIQDLKARGKGLGDMIEQLEYVFRMALPDEVEFKFDFVDDEQDEKRARVKVQTTQALTALVASGIINTDEAKAMAIKENLLDIETLNTVTQAMIDADPVTDDTPTEQTERTAGEPLSTVDAEPANDSEVPDNVIDTREARGWQVSEKDYKRAANAFVRSVTQSASPTLFPAQLRRAGDEAYLQGVRDAGGTLTAIDRQAREQLAGWVASQSDWIRGFQEALELNDAGEVPIDVQARADMWANKSLYDAYFLGLTRGNSGRKATWTLGVAEHCVDCLALSGQTKTLKEWDEFGIRPRSSELACKGINCKCTLVLS